MSSSGLSDNQILAIVRIEVFFRVDPRSGRNKFLVRFLGEILLLLLRIDLQREDLLILARCCNVFIFFRLILTCSLTFDKKLYFKIYLLQFRISPSFVNEKISIIKKYKGKSYLLFSFASIIPLRTRLRSSSSLLFGILIINEKFQSRWEKGKKFIPFQRSFCELKKKENKAPKFFYQTLAARSID